MARVFGVSTHVRGILVAGGWVMLFGNTHYG
jgi:hypothetical protein